MKALAVLVDPGTLADGARVCLDESERHHLDVRRASAGVELLVFDGEGNVGSGAYDGRDTVTVRAVRRAERLAETVLAVGAGDRERFLAVAERCTELGVTVLVPLVTERAHAVANRFRDGALDKARRRAREACKQSENPWATLVAARGDLGDLPARYSGVRWFLADAAAPPCPPIAPAESVGWLVGPEGGFTDEEIEAARTQLRATRVGLGPAMLRFDTAAAVAAAMTHDRRTAAGR